jgi:molybdate transport system permease protein
MPTVAGPRVHWVSVLSVGALAVFVLAVLVLIAVDIGYTRAGPLVEVLHSRAIRHAIWLTLVTTAVSLVVVIAFAVPVGYALSRYRFPGSVVVDAVVDLPIVLPPIVIGISLLVLFQTPAGRWVQAVEWPAAVRDWIAAYPAWLGWLGARPLEFVYTPKGIVLCQFFASASYGIRAAQAAFDGSDRRLEDLALTLGCTHGQAMRMVALPMARSGLVAGAVLAWAKAVGLFAPLMIFAGTVRMKTEVLPTTVYLELSIGRIEPALAVALVMLALAMAALVVIHGLGAGRQWWRR